MTPTKRETLFPSWWFQTHWKILVKLDHFPQIGVKLIKNLKPPPSDECFILQICSLNFPTTFAVGFFEAEDHLSITAGWLVAGSCAHLVLPPNPTNNKKVTRAILSRFWLLIWSLQIPYGRLFCRTSNTRHQSAGVQCQHSIHHCLVDGEWNVLQSHPAGPTTLSM